MSEPTRQPASYVMTTRSSLRCRVLATCSGTGAQPLRRNFHSATYALGSEDILHGAAELVGNELADHRRTIAGRARNGDRRPAGFAPFKSHVIQQATV